METPQGGEKKPPSVALQVFLGLFLYFVVLPIATCTACATCGVAATGMSKTAGHR